jgi:hypothetical protein
MEIMVRDRREGKTTHLLEWLLEGTFINEPPYWSRVLVVMHGAAEQERLRRLVLEQMRKKQVERGAVEVPDHHIDRARLAVWRFDDWHRNVLGIRRDAPWTYAIDNAEAMFAQVLGSKEPERVTMNGKLWRGTVYR